MAIIDKIYLKNEFGQDEAYDIGADGSNVAYNNTTSVNSKIDSINSTLSSVSGNLNTHTNSVVSGAGTHGLRYTDDTGVLEANVNGTQKPVSTGSNEAAIPVCTDRYVYNGSAQTPNFIGYDSEKMTASGLSAKTDAGSYSVTFTLKSGYKQEDGTTSAKTAIQKIEKAIPTIGLTGRQTDARITLKGNSFYITFISDATRVAIDVGNRDISDVYIQGETELLSLSPDDTFQELTGEDLNIAYYSPSSGQQYQEQHFSAKQMANRLCFLTAKETANTKAVKYNVYVTSGIDSMFPICSQATGSDNDILEIIHGYYFGKSESGGTTYLPLDEIKGMQAIGDIRRADTNKTLLKVNSHIVPRISNGSNWQTSYTLPEMSTIKQIIADFDHDTPVNAEDTGIRSKALLTIRMAGCISSNKYKGYYLMSMNNTDTNTDGWTGSVLYNYLNTNFYNACAFKDHIIPVKKLTCLDNTSTVLTESNDKIFLPSETETGIKRESERLGPVADEGSYYNFYAINRKVNSGYDTDSVGDYRDRVWSRTLIPNNTTQFEASRPDSNDYHNKVAASQGAYVSPMCCL